MGFGGGGFAPGLEVLDLEEREKPLIAILGGPPDSSLEGDMAFTFAGDKARRGVWFGFYKKYEGTR